MSKFVYHSRFTAWSFFANDAELSSAALEPALAVLLLLLPPAPAPAPPSSDDFDADADADADAEDEEDDAGEEEEGATGEPLPDLKAGTYANPGMRLTTLSSFGSGGLGSCHCVVLVT